MYLLPLCELDRSLSFRVNHSCVPNAETSWKSELNMMELVTTRNIRKGEEVTICYLNKVVKVFASSTGSLAKINGLTEGEKYCCKGPKSFVHQKKKQGNIVLFCGLNCEMLFAGKLVETEREKRNYICLLWICLLLCRMYRSQSFWKNLFDQVIHFE